MLLLTIKFTPHCKTFEFLVSIDISTIFIDASKIPLSTSYLS